MIKPISKINYNKSQIDDKTIKTKNDFMGVQNFNSLRENCDFASSKVHFQVAFTGLNTTKIIKKVVKSDNFGKKLLKEAASQIDDSKTKNKLVSSVKKAAKSVGNIFNKYKKLPVVDKPVIAAALEGPNEFLKNTLTTNPAVNPNYDGLNELLSDLAVKSIKLPPTTISGDIPIADNGKLLSSAKTHLVKRIEEEYKAGHLSEYEHKDFTKRISLCGHNNAQLGFSKVGQIKDSINVDNDAIFTDVHKLPFELNDVDLSESVYGNFDISDVAKPSLDDIHTNTSNVGNHLFDAFDISDVSKSNPAMVFTDVSTKHDHVFDVFDISDISKPKSDLPLTDVAKTHNHLFDAFDISNIKKPDLDLPFADISKTSDHVFDIFDVTKPKVPTPDISDLHESFLGKLGIDLPDFSIPDFGIDDIFDHLGDFFGELLTNLKDLF